MQKKTKLNEILAALRKRHSTKCHHSEIPVAINEILWNFICTENSILSTIHAARLQIAFYATQFHVEKRKNAHFQYKTRLTFFFREKKNGFLFSCTKCGFLFLQMQQNNVVKVSRLLLYWLKVNPKLKWTRKTDAQLKSTEIARCHQLSVYTSQRWISLQNYLITQPE